MNFQHLNTKYSVSIAYLFVASILQPTLTFAGVEERLDTRSTVGDAIRLCDSESRAVAAACRGYLDGLVLGMKECDVGGMDWLAALHEALDNSEIQWQMSIAEAVDVMIECEDMI